MVRRSAALVLLTALAGVGHACPWWGRPSHPGPVVVYPYGPPPVVVYHPCPPPVIVYHPAPAPAEPPAAVEKELDPEALYEKAVRSCVFLVTPRKGGLTTADGVLIDAEKRLVLTTFEAVGENDHTFAQFPVRNKNGSLLTDTKKYLERIPAGLAIKGKVLFRDQSRELALVQLDKLPPETPALPLAPESVRVGSKVYGIGHWASENLAFDMTSGQVRGVGVWDLVVGAGEGNLVRTRMLAITNPIRGGPNGGPIVDNRGRMVGLTFGRPANAAAPGISSALDVTEIRTFLKEKKVDVGAPPPRPEPPPGRASAEDEKAAAVGLARAKLFAEGEENRVTYRAKLNELVRKYPDTAAAREARKILDGLK